MTPGELYEAGELDQAVEAALETVRSRPSDAGARWMLCELMCLRGEFDRAEKHLATLSDQQPDMASQVALFRQLVRAALTRRDVFESGAAPELLEPATPVIERTLKLLLSIREGEDCSGRLEEIEEASPVVSGTCNGAEFTGVRDLDDVSAHVAEVMTSTGKYFWIPYDCIEELEFAKPERPRDLIWRQVHMTVRGGPDGEVYWPCLYPGTERLEDNALRLGRATDWTESSGVVRGTGLRMMLWGEEDRPVLELEKVVFSEPRSIASG